MKQNMILFLFQLREMFCEAYYLPTVYSCGFDCANDFAQRVLVPKELLPLPRGFVGTPNTVAVVSVTSNAKCRTDNFTGIMLYIDGESGEFSAPFPTNRDRIIYLGISGNVSVMHNRHAVGVLDSSITRINMIYGADAFHYDRQNWDVNYSRPLSIDNSHRSEFLAYAASSCVPERERVFDVLVNFCKHHGRSHHSLVITNKCGE